MSPRLAGVVAIALGLVVGGLIGNFRFERFESQQTLCASCHHGTLDPAELTSAPPHTTDFDAPCHGCHVLPVREYLQTAFASAGADAPEWVDGMTNPTIDNQTCLECHLARGRGVIACERCHADGTLDVRLTERCDACHDNWIPLAPHNRPGCRDCHAEVYLDPHGRAERLMGHKLGTTEDWRNDEHH